MGESWHCWLNVGNFANLLPTQPRESQRWPDDECLLGYFDEISEGITLSNSKKRFCVTVFLAMMDILSCKQINCFEEIKSFVTSYQVLEPSFLSNASHLDLEVEAKKFSNKFSDNVFPLFPS